MESAITHYFLYGEGQESVESDFLHVEAIPLRSGANDWTIRPHSHPGHLQILLVTGGGGSIDVEAVGLEIPSPSLVVVPAGNVHSIEFSAGTEGQVTTAALTYASAIAGGDPAVMKALATPAVYPLDPRQLPSLGLVDAFDWLQREFVRTFPGRRMAVRAHFERILVALLRLHSESSAGMPARAKSDLALVQRYRELLEAHFRTEKQLGFYALKLGVTLSKLHAACRTRTGVSASKLLHERIIVEAKRNLLYSNYNVAQIAHAMGFEDPAYFNRFFSQRVGMAPGAFRDREHAAPVRAAKTMSDA